MKEINPQVKATVNKILDEFWTAISNTEKNERYKRLSMGRTYPDEYEEALSIIKKRLDKERNLVLTEGFDARLILEQRFQKMKRQYSLQIAEYLIRTFKINQECDTGDRHVLALTKILEEAMFWEYKEHI